MAATESTRTQLASWLTLLAAGTGNPIVYVGASLTQGVGATQDGAHSPADLFRIAVANRNSKAVGVGWISAYRDWGAVGGIGFWPDGWGSFPGTYPANSGGVRPTLRPNSAGWSVDYAAGGQTSTQTLTCTRLDGYFDTVPSGGGSAQLFVDGVAFGSPTSVNAGSTRESGHKLITWTSAVSTVPEQHSFQWKFTTNPVTFNGAHVANSNSFDVINLSIGGSQPSDYNSGGTYDRGVIDFIRVNTPALIVVDLELNAVLVSNKSSSVFQSDMTTFLAAVRAASPTSAVITTHDPLTDSSATYDAPQPEIWSALWKPALKAAGDAMTAPRAAVFDAAAIIGDLSGNNNSRGFLNSNLDSLHMTDAGYAAWEVGFEYTAFMATTSDLRSINATFTGTTADIGLLTQFWDSITIRNNDTTNTVYVRFDGTTPVAGQEGAYIVGPGSSRTFSTGIKNSAGIPGSTTPATACHQINIVGNGGAYGIDGGSPNGPGGSQAVTATGISGGTWTVTDGTSSHGSVSMQVASPGFSVANIGIKANANDANNALNFGVANGSVFISKTPPTGTVGTTVPSNILLDMAISNATSDTGTVDGTEADLKTDTLAANQFLANNDTVEAFYSGNVLSTGGTTKRVRVYFDGTVIWDSAALTIASGGQWSVTVRVMRVSTTAVNIWALGSVSGPTTTVTQPQLVTKLTGLTSLAANTKILKVTGQSSGGTPATNDVVCSLKKLVYVPA